MPLPGVTNTAHAHTVDVEEGTSGGVELAVETTDLGQVLVSEEVYEFEEFEGTPPTTDPCGVIPYYPLNRRVSGDWRYYTNTGYLRPSSMDETSARLGLKAGFDGILTARNSCGLADVMPRTATLVGATSRLACNRGFGDHVNVLGFGDLENHVSGVNCTSTSNGIATESDTRINSSDFNWVRTITGTCEHSMHLDSTMTHEIGHLYGLGDTTADSNRPLTMFGSYARCSEYKFTLAFGDWRGLEAMY